MSGPQVDYVEYVEGRLAWLRRLAYLLCQDWHEATVKSQTSKGLAALRRMLEPAWGGGPDRG